MELYYYGASFLLADGGQNKALEEAPRQRPERGLEKNWHDEPAR